MVFFINLGYSSMMEFACQLIYFVIDKFFRKIGIVFDLIDLCCAITKVVVRDFGIVVDVKA